MLLLAYSMSYGAPPTPEEIQFRLWIFIAVVSLPSLVVYGLSKWENREHTESVLSYAMVLPIIMGVVVGTVGSPSIWVPVAATFLLCAGLELCRFGWWGCVKGTVGVVAGALILHGTLGYTMRHFLMTGWQ